MVVKMPETIEDIMLAPCGMNCTVCYKHVGIRKHAKPCEGCLKGDEGKPEHCRQCKIKNCVQSKGFVHCFECADFPCKLIKDLEKSYIKRYSVSLIENSQTAREKGIAEFLAHDKQKWTCADCGGAFSLHDGTCSDCQGNMRSQQ
jgi:hypothetical protein